MIDLVLGALVFGAFMLAWWRERDQRPAPFVIDDELLHAISQHTLQMAQTMRSVGVASAKAAESLRRFQDAYLESVRRGTAG